MDKKHIFFKVENNVVTPLITLPALKLSKKDAKVSENINEKRIDSTENISNPSEKFNSKEIINKYSRKFDMSYEQFNKVLSKINGFTYNFIELGKSKKMEEADDYSYPNNEEVDVDEKLEEISFDNSDGEDSVATDSRLEDLEEN